MNNKKKHNSEKLSVQDKKKLEWSKERKDKETSKNWSVLTQLNNLS